MMKVKRMLAFVLALAMTLSLVVFPASAEEAFTVSLSDATATVTQTEGQEVTVDVNVSGLKENKGWSALTLYVYYDSEVLEFQKGKLGTAGMSAGTRLMQDGASLSFQIAAEKDAQDANGNNDKEELCVGIAATAAASGNPVLVTETGTIWTLTFKAKADLESQQLPLTLVCTKAEVSGDSTIVPVTNGATITINGVAPELDYVEVTDATGNVLAYSKSETEKYPDEKRAGEVKLDSETSYTYFVKAYSKKGTDITDQVQWSISHDPTKTVGAQLDETDKENKIVKVTIPEKGGRPNGVTLSEITAKMPEAETSKTAKILYRRADSIPTSANISLREGSSASLQVPGTDAADVTAQFDAVVYDQFGENITRTALGSSCKWYVESANAGSTSTSGISMNYSTGLLTVSSKALSTVQNGNTNYTVFIRADQSAGGKRVGTYPITVSLSNRVPTSVVISDGPEGSTLAVPKTGESNATYTATVKDQYGAEMADPGTIEWKLRNESTGDTFSQKGVTIDQNGALTITKKAAGNPFPNGTSRLVFIEATCGGATERTSFTLTREPAEVTTLEITGPDTLVVPTKSEYPNGQITPYPVTIYDQYGVEMNSDDYSFGRELETTGVSDVIFQPDGVKVTCYAAENQFDQNNALTFTIKASCVGKEATKTITLKREPSVATAITYNDTETTVVPTNEDSVSAKATPAVEDQYGLLMNNATVKPDGALPAGIVLENGELYITKAAKTHFGGERRDEVQVFVNLKCGESAKNTVKLKLKLAAAQINKDSAEITGTASIAKPTGEQTNTAVYSILNNEIKDQYGLPLTFEPSKLTMKLYSDAACGNEVTNGPVTLSGNTITVTSGADVNTKYYLKAKYSDMQCAPVKEITIVDKTVSNTLTVTQGDFTYGEEGKLNPVVKKDGEMITNATFVYTKGGQTVTEVKDAGKYTVTATCEDANYIYTGSKDFEIKPKEINVGWIALDSTRYTYNGTEQTVQYTVKDGNTTLVKDRDYTVKDNSDSGTDAGVYRLEITGKGNYTSDPTGAPSVNWNIWEATLTVAGADIPAINYDPDFDGALNVNSVTFSGLVNGETLAKGTDYTVAATVGNRNAGTHQVVLTVRLLNGNYKFEQGSGIVIKDNANITVTINKIDHQAEAVSVGCKYGSTVRVPLAEYLPDGWSVQQSAISVDSNGNGNVHKSFRLEDTTLVVELNNNEALVGKYVKITLPVASTNYNPFTIT
ncbi:MAG: hypothetical protein Q4D08_08510, partial [Clostridia bacterium]|nr:hypothetical protein [Clostridia bacterium]